jgi:uncharacterized protein
MKAGNSKTAVICFSSALLLLSLNCNSGAEQSLEKSNPGADKALKAASNTNPQKNIMEKLNPVSYFEIPVNDLGRAAKFYKAVFDFEFERQAIDGNEMALFPLIENGKGISGALAKGSVYKPTKNGVIIYFNSDDIDASLKKAIENGGKQLYPKTSIGDLGFVAEFEDSEGNRIALHSPKK